MSGFALMDAGTEAADLITQMFNDTTADGLSNNFSAAYQPSMDGFGPGDYSGGYTGQGDAIYWGPLGDNGSSTASIASHHQGFGFGPGGIAQQAAGSGNASVTDGSTGSTILNPETAAASASQTTSVIASDPASIFADPPARPAWAGGNAEGPIDLKRGLPPIPDTEVPPEVLPPEVPPSQISGRSSTNHC